MKTYSAIIRVVSIWPLKPSRKISIEVNCQNKEVTKKKYTILVDFHKLEMNSKQDQPLCNSGGYKIPDLHLWTRNKSVIECESESAWRGERREEEKRRGEVRTLKHRHRLQGLSHSTWDLSKIIFCRFCLVVLCG